MRAVVLTEYGSIDNIEVQELPDPTPGPREVRVRVAAATVNPADLNLLSGVVAEYLTGEFPLVPGLEAAGTVDAVGPGASWQVGEQVVVHVSWMPEGRGAQAELIVAHSDQLGPVPGGSTMAEAATLPMNALTALGTLDVMDLPSGSTIAVTGAAGAVGGYAIQLAAERGHQVVAVASPGDEALMRELGAKVFVPRGELASAWIREMVPGGVDGVVDAAAIGGSMLAAVRDGGRIAQVQMADIEMERGITSHLVLVSRDHLREPGKLRWLAGLVEAGKLTLRVADTFSPEKASEAYRRLTAGGERGRLVVTFS